MDPISNVDRLVLLLHQRLSEKARTSRQPGKRPSAQQAAGRRSIEKLASMSDLEERQFKRALIAHILADQLSEGILNDARFQQAAEKVTETLENDPEGQRLFAAVIADLKGGR